MTTLALTVAEEPWFDVTRVRPDLDLIVEPHVDEFLRANIWLIHGSRSAALIDCGLGVAPLAPLIATLTQQACPVILTHGHLDHAGSAHEFAERWGHLSDEVRDERHLSLSTHEHAQDLGIDTTELGAAGDWMLTRLPHAEFDPRDYRQLPAPLTRHLEDGDWIDLGSCTLEVLHLPGHTPGSIALYDAERGELYSGDIVYDDELLDSLPESDIPAYRASLRRLRALPVTLVRPGHGPCFDGERLREIIDRYLAATEDSPDAEPVGATDAASSAGKNPLPSVDSNRK